MNNMPNPSEDENFAVVEDCNSDDDSSAHSILQSIYADSCGSQESLGKSEDWLSSGEDWPGANIFHSTSLDGEPVAAFRSAPPAFKADLTYDSECRASIEAAPTISLEVLVHRLLQPGCATSDTNFIRAAIMLHADLSKHCSALDHHSKLNDWLQYCSSGSSHAWLYTPRRHSNRTTKSGNGGYEYFPEGLALILVYPDDSTMSRSANGTSRTLPSSSGLRFGGRAYSLGDGSVHLQHGSYQRLRYVFLPIYPVGNDILNVFLHRKLPFLKSARGLCTIRLKARKYQLVGRNSSPEPRPHPSPSKVALAQSLPQMVSAPQIDPVLHLSPPSVSAQSELISLSSLEKPSVGHFYRDVERIRRELNGCDLQRKLVILREEWALEVASTSGLHLISDGDSTDAIDTSIDIKCGDDIHCLKRVKAL